MTQDSDYCVVLTTVGDQAEARRLAEALVSQKLAACVQILDIQSYYWWEESVNNAPECLLLVKTRSDLYQQVEAFIVQNHSYELPEVVQLPIVQGLNAYLHWIRDSTV